MAFKLSIEQGKGRGQAFDFDVTTITIGRAEENDVVLYDEQGVSRRHARIFSEDGQFFVEDLESANGTLLNGARVKKEVLAEGDTVGIGSVVFRFGTGKGKSEDGSTRIVHLSKTNPKAEAPKKADKKADKTADKKAEQTPATGTPGAAAEGGNVSTRLIAGGVALALLLAVGIAWATKPASSSRRGACMDPIPYEDAARLVVFGNNNEATCTAKKKLALSFNAEPGMKLLLSYAPFYTSPNEVKILLNDQKVGDVEASATRHGKRRTLVLPEPKPGKNVIAFVADKAEDWGVERVEIQLIHSKEADLAKAQEEYERGKQLIERQHVASSNLYNGWRALRAARRHMEGLAEKPPTYEAVNLLIDQSEQKLDKLCKEQLFRATRQGKYGEYDTAHETYEFLLQAFPGDELPCRVEALRRMGMVGATASNE